MTDSATLQKDALAAIAASSSLPALEELRVSYLGKKGALTEQLKSLGTLSPDARKAAGAALNEVKLAITKAIAQKQATLEEAAINARLAGETIDVTLPGRLQQQGTIHPTSQVMEEVVTIFARMGFRVEEGPQIEDDYHNFTALNIPESHPARQMHDTFYLAEKDERGNPLLLRTHTSPVQIRAMQSGKPPFRFIAPGATYRCDSDATHTPQFHQVEGLVIEKNIHMGHLKGCLQDFMKAFFKLDEVPMRFRPSFFPFTEPSAEVDIGYARKDGGIVIGGGTDWLEVAGCGMVHPNVLTACGIDPNEWQGFAFGMGIERFAMLKYGIPDIRACFESDLRWLKHYGFDPLDIPATVE